MFIVITDILFIFGTLKLYVDYMEEELNNTLQKEHIFGVQNGRVSGLFHFATEHLRRRDKLLQYFFYFYILAYINCVV